mmetsp:Transcript_2592/g.5878  ORF Transcript_2592/g.5878 Transcript_2592/m.5878 type:complete len:86 (+) Transcript_2592:3649-3906(+)
MQSDMESKCSRRLSLSLGLCSRKAFMSARFYRADASNLHFQIQSLPESFHFQLHFVEAFEALRNSWSHRDMLQSQLVKGLLSEST